MKKTLIIFLALFYFICLSNVKAAEDLTQPVTGPASIESMHIENTKVDSTGGLQIPGGIYAAPSLSGIGVDLQGFGGNVLIPVSKKDLDPYRGPDVLNSCAYFESSLIGPTKTICQQLMQQMSSSGSSSSGSSSGVTSATPCTAGSTGGPATCPGGGTCNTATNQCIVGCTPGSSSGSATCPNGGYCNAQSNTCLSSGETCDGGCRTDTQSQTSSWAPGTWFEYSTAGGYQYDKCTYYYDTISGEWQETRTTVTVSTPPCDCTAPCGATATPYTTSGSSSGSSSTSSGSGSSTSSSSGGGACTPNGTSGSTTTPCPGTQFCSPVTNTCTDYTECPAGSGVKAYNCTPTGSSHCANIQPAVCSGCRASNAATDPNAVIPSGVYDISPNNDCKGFRYARCDYGAMSFEFVDQWNGYTPDPWPNPQRTGNPPLTPDYNPSTPDNPGNYTNWPVPYGVSTTINAAGCTCGSPPC